VQITHELPDFSKKKEFLFLRLKVLNNISGSERRIKRIEVFCQKYPPDIIKLDEKFWELLPKLC